MKYQKPSLLLPTVFFTAALFYLVVVNFGFYYYNLEIPASALFSTWSVSAGTLFALVEYRRLVNDFKALDEAVQNLEELSKSIGVDLKEELLKSSQ